MSTSLPAPIGALKYAARSTRRLYRQFRSRAHIASEALTRLSAPSPQPPGTDLAVVACQPATAAVLPSVAHEQSASPEHAAILAAFEETARLGHVPADALIGRLHACHCDKLAQDRQRLVALEQELEGHLARLDARFPVPPPPEPEKPLPPRGRRFGPISRDLRVTAPGSATRQ